jgi:phosphoribosylaminoimidazolecarboxamide formyltransferase/IMP cyclohydrolase
MTKIATALLSVWDKTELLPLAQALHRHGTKLISTGGTAKVLTEAGLPVTDISAVTGRPEAFGGRMKTLSYEIASGLLFDRDRDAEEAKNLGISPIDLVVCNLYPFEHYRQQGLPLDKLIEYIDIGGPTMIRAAAKNVNHVAVLTDPGDYAAAIAELDQTGGELSQATRLGLMRKAFNRTADYDAAIASHLDQLAGAPSVRLHLHEGQPLRYGENPHQKAIFYPKNGLHDGLGALEILGGKELSYNNLVDLGGALDAVAGLAGPSCAIIKHTNPCGLASSSTLAEALDLAWAGDPVSAFGSVIAFNRPVDRPDVLALALDDADKGKRRFVEIVAAPDFTGEALDYLRQHKALRILKIDANEGLRGPEYRFVRGALLAQDADRDAAEKREVASVARPTVMDEDLIRFGTQAARCVKSNAIAIVRRRGAAAQLLGMGAGQPNRVNSVKLALDRALANLRAESLLEGEAREAECRHKLGECTLVSDAFFPFPDGVELALGAGVKTIIQPGGSIRDGEVIAACDRHGGVMVLTGTRHFKH